MKTATIEGVNRTKKYNLREFQNVYIPRYSYLKRRWKSAKR